VKIVLLGTQEYNWMLPPFEYFFRKYWGDDLITYVTDKVVLLPPNWYCLQVPAYTEGKWDWGNYFNNGLMSIFEYFEDELLIILLLDHWFNQSVNIILINYLVEYMLEHPNIIRGNLTAGTCLDSYGEKIDEYKGLEIITVGSAHQHCSFGGGITFCPSIFNRKRMLELLNGLSFSFHRTESEGTKMMRLKPHLYTVGTRQPILYRTHALHHCRHGVISCEGLSSEDKQHIRRLVSNEIIFE